MKLKWMSYLTLVMIIKLTAPVLLNITNKDVLCLFSHCMQVLQLPNVAELKLLNLFKSSEFGLRLIFVLLLVSITLSWRCALAVRSDCGSEAPGGNSSAPVFKVEEPAH